MKGISYLLKTLYFNFIAASQRDAMILESLKQSPKTAPMLTQELGFDIDAIVLILMERKGLIISYWDEARLPERNYHRRRFYTLKLVIDS